MNDTSFIRARRPEQKAQRAEEILDAARLLLDEGGLEAVTLAAIAREAGVVKSNLYRYFESREEILFRLMLEESHDLIDSGVTNLAPLAGTDDIPALAGIMAGDFATRPRFCLLISRMAPILEQNISVETLIEMKREVVGLLLRIAEAISKAIPSLTQDAALQGLNMVIHNIAGLWPIAHPPEAVSMALEEPDLAFMKQEFETAAAEAIAAIFEGVRVGQSRGSA